MLLENKTQNDIFDIVKTWTLEDRKKLNFSAYKLDLAQNGPNNKSIGEWINNICELSLRGLGRRNKQYSIDNEESFLKEYLDIFKKNGIFAIHTQKEIKKSDKTVIEFI